MTRANNHLKWKRVSLWSYVATRAAGCYAAKRAATGNWHLLYIAQDTCIEAQLEDSKALRSQTDDIEANAIRDAK